MRHLTRGGHRWASFVVETWNSSSKSEVATRKRWRGAKFQGCEREHKTGWSERWVQSAHSVWTACLVQPCLLANIFRLSCLYIVFEDTKFVYRAMWGHTRTYLLTLHPSHVDATEPCTQVQVSIFTREGCGRNIARPCVGTLSII